MILRNLTLLAGALLVAPSAARADDWPQWMGPKRDNVWSETGILDKFPAGGPKVAWRTPVAGGYAGPAVSGGLVYVTDYVTAADVKIPNFDRKEFSGTERVLCLDQKTGKEKWKHEYPVKYAISYPAGPRCTPTVHDGKVYTLGAEGNLICFEAAGGKVVWEKELKKEYKTKSALWGFAAHPLVDGKKLVTLVGGEGSHVVAFDKDTGKEIWKAGTQPEQGYSPVLITEAAGQRQMIVAGTKSVYAVDPDTGKELWKEDFAVDNGCIVMTPVRSGDHLFVGGYHSKSMVLKLKSDKPGAEVVWKNKKGMGLSPVNVQPFLKDGVLYGYDDSGNMFAVELPSGKHLWEAEGPVAHEPKGSETAFIVKNGDRFFFFAETGHLVIGKLTPKGYEEIDRAKVLDQTNSAFGRKVVWCAPAYADKKAYIRNDKEIICVDLAK
ncbi:MAG: PQQ-like beta-propeller repeat protein [Planctomycetes bacterium]|nr:PQQ-like beta-propeller repeat protein [Planctomycetota bacterium]